MLSPNAMAQAVLDSAIAERTAAASQTSETAAETLGGMTVAAQESNNKRPRPVADNDRDGKDVKEQLKQVWEGSDKDAAMHDTMTLVHGQIEHLIRAGLEAYHGMESANRDLSQAKEECEAKDRELRRLRASEEQSRATITVSSRKCVVFGQALFGYHGVLTSILFYTTMYNRIS